MKNRSWLVLLLVFVGAGCTSEATTNVTANASQAEIDNYNRLIEAEAARVSESTERKDI